MKNKKTIADKLANRKYKRPNKFLYGALYKIIVRKVLEPKYNVHYQVIDDINQEKGPCFLIYNHQSRMDYIWAMHLAYPTRLNYMVGYNEFFRSHLHLIMKIANSIPKKNFTMDLPAMRAMDKLIKQNAVICFAPEGMSSISGHNQPIVPSTGKLFKKYGIPVYMVHSKGAFLTNTKVCLDERKGKIEASISKLFSPEDLKTLSAEELDKKINEALWQDDYEWNQTEKISYESHGRICTHMSDLLYRCPKCGSEFEMESEGDHIVCKHCGNGATMDDTYTFHPYHEDDVLPSTPSRWFDEERKLVYQEIKNNPKASFSFNVKLGELPKYKYLKDLKTSNVVGEGKVTIDHDGFHYRGTKNGEQFDFDLNYSSIPTFGMPVDTSYFSIYYDGECYDMFPDGAYVGKALLMNEEMARLHTGNWLNFPWLSWIYE